MSKIDELLAVLDMPEDEQIIWCAKNAGYDLLDSTLADLAFRLRDEVKKQGLNLQYYNAAQWVMYKATGSHNHGDYKDKWFSYNAQPIHWIIAALIAKELAKENQ